MYPQRTVPIFKGKKIKHVSDLIAILAILGPCSMQDCAEKAFAKKALTSTIEQDTVRIRENNYRNLCNDTMRNDQKYFGLISDEYIFKTDKEGKFSNYTLTLKGCLLSLGYDFNETELSSFIKNAAKTHLFFAYVNKILEKTSLKFVKEVFVLPIQEIIKKGRITLDDDIRFYFSNIAEACGYALYKKLTKILNDYYTEFDTGKTTDSISSVYPKINYINTVKKNTFYYVNRPEDWIDSIIEYFYSNNEQENFYEYHSSDQSFAMENGLLYKVMREMHNGYFDAYAMMNPNYTNKLPRSKKWKNHVKYKKINASRSFSHGITEIDTTTRKK